jgi:hypothetical protein
MTASRYVPRYVPANAVLEIVPEALSAYVAVAREKPEESCDILIVLDDPCVQSSETLFRLLEMALRPIVKAAQTYDEDLIRGEKGEIVWNLFQQDKWAIRLSCHPWNTFINRRGIFT